MFELLSIYGIWLEYGILQVCEAMFFLYFYEVSLLMKPIKMNCCFISKCGLSPHPILNYKEYKDYRISKRKKLDWMSVGRDLFTYYH